MYYTTNISGQTKKSKTSKGRPFIPPFYECNLNVFGLDNIKIVNTDYGIQVYVTPIIRTLLTDIRSYSTIKDGETLGRRIKDRMDSNSRLLIKKGLEKSPIQYINGKQYLLVNCEIRKVNDNLYRVMNG